MDATERLRLGLAASSCSRLTSCELGTALSNGNSNALAALSRLESGLPSMSSAAQADIGCGPAERLAGDVSAVSANLFSIEEAELMIHHDQVLGEG